MLRIVRNEETPGIEVLRLEGRVIGQWVDELHRSCQEVLDRPGTLLVLDLADVSFIDLNGLKLFRTLISQRVALKNCSPFAAEQLREVGGLR